MDAPSDTTQAHGLNRFCRLLRTTPQSFVS
jgi:hypothetical protein